MSNAKLISIACLYILKLGKERSGHTRLDRHWAPPSDFTVFDKLGTWPDDFTGLIVYISTSNANKIQ